MLTFKLYCSNRIWDLLFTTWGKKWFFLFSLLIVLCIGADKIKAKNFEIWTFVGAGTEWKTVEFSLQNANFFQADGGWFLNNTQLSFDFNTQRNLNFGVAYKQEYVKILDKTRIEYRPMLHLYYSAALGHFEFRDRNRLEFRFFETGMVNRYRNQLRLAYKKFDKIVPYAATEFFFYFEEFNYVRQRSALGVDIPIKSVNLNLFGAHQIDKVLQEFWYEKFMLGTSLNYRF